MSAGTSRHPPYHLRPNKAIDRFLLVDLLRHVPYEDRKRYEYVGLGGPFLEDFKVMHHYYPELLLTSIEENADTYKRQKFNKTCRSIKLVENDIATYFGEHEDFRHPLIVWFDGTDFQPETIENIQTILAKLPLNSILKVTARVSLDMAPQYKEFAGSISRSIKEYLNTVQYLPSAKRGQILNSIDGILRNAAKSKDEITLATQRVSDYLPEGYETLLSDQPSRAKLFFQILQNAIFRVYPSTGDKIFHLISSNYYSDGTTMISVTGMLVERSSLAKVKELFRAYKPQGDQLIAPEKIDVPVLSVKERMKIDAYLPMRRHAGRRIREVLGYKIEKTVSRTEAQLEFYNMFHKYYPFFSKVQL